MANHVLNYYQLFGIIVLIVAAESMMLIVAGESSCSQDPLGACGPSGQCDQRCKAKHPGSKGSCNMGLCTCDYCSKSSPPEKTYCTGGLGLCTADCNNDCCNAKCASKYTQGKGFCNPIGSNRLCTCQYLCPFDAPLTPAPPLE